ncbi:hypothetical protein MSPP1_001210 [Malassezia sp. CBS 17886]|nr:hypothetical protein MSPP1_001210 [Malassezia sp. CBS 17886]
MGEHALEEMELDGDDAQCADDASFGSASDASDSDEYEPEDGGAARPPADVADEVEIEQDDFTRLISAFTSEPAGGGRRKDARPGDARSSWNQSMEAEMESFHHELRDVNGYTRKRKATRIREQALSPEVKSLLAQANLAYVEADLPAATRQLEEVIRIEPTVKGAWYTLGMCFEELGEEEKSIQCRIVGAHLTSNASDEWKSLARRSRERGLFQQSIYCLQQAIKKNRFDVDAIWDRAVMLKDSGRLRAAVDAFQAVLKLHPYDAEVLRELVPLLVSLGEYDVGVHILEGMRRASMAHGVDPNLDPALAEADPAASRAPAFTLNELVTLADLLLLLKRPMQVVVVVQQTVRWMRGAARDEEPADMTSDIDLDEAPSAPGTGLDREVRLRLGKARFTMKQHHEGIRHFGILAAETDPVDAPVLFLEIADCYFEHHMFRDALEWYRILIDEGLIDDVQAWTHMGICYQQMDDPQMAAHVYDAILEEYPDNFDVKLGLAEVCEELGQRDRALALVNEVLLARNELRQQAPEAPEGGDAYMDVGVPAGEGASLSFFNETAPEHGAAAPAPGATRSSRTGLSFAERQRLEQLREEETRLAWVQLSALEPKVFVDGFWRRDLVFLDAALDREYDEATQARFAATRQWMDVAQRLVESFRSMALLFPKERYTKYRGVVRPRRGRRSKASDLDSHAEELLSRLRDHLVDEASDEDFLPEQNAFRTIHFDDWVLLFMKYGVALAKLGGEEETINDMFRHVMVSNTVWPSEERKVALHLCWLACAMYARDYVRVFDIARWFPTHYQFHNEPLRLTASLANGLGFYGVDSFVSATNTKQYQRRMRTHEAVVTGRPAKVNPRTGRWTMAGVDEEDEPALGSKGGGGRGGAAGWGECDAESARGADGSEGELQERSEGAWGEPQDGDANDLPTLEPPAAQSQPTKPSPIGEMFYGYLMLCANSYQPAMGYLLRALVLQPKDALLCLLCSVACLSRATNRQVDNRNHTVVQGLSLLANYAALRGDCAEAEYNFGRAFHQLGLLHLAVPRYQRVLELAEKGASPGLGYAMTREAAYNLSLIYAGSGSPRLARTLYRRWLLV